MKRALLLFLAVSMAHAGESVTVTKENVATFYQKFMRLISSPRFVPRRIILACGAPDPGPVIKDPQMDSPHAGAWVNVLANASAIDAIITTANEFPEGAVIVKEKLDSQKQPTEIGGMIKRARAYDPANADWEYFYRDRAGNFTSGKLANCASCHNAAPRAQLYSVWKLKK